MNIPLDEFAARVLKVNHSGENGAVNIYAGQIFLARLTAPGIVAQLTEFKSHEERHRAIFWAELQRRERPRCRSYWLCGIGGFMLGLVTAIFGQRAIAATTVAVERVVLHHLEQQLKVLSDKDEEAAKAVGSIVMEERLHHDQSVSLAADDGFWSRVLLPVVSASTEAVIWIGMRG
ncbi:demethoxyubiquinone hydroxylase family protein [Pseudoduganella eburnea]|uniref:Demethoxyubiquinone hydroxylase family protein n=1 Tax=Massilia eburnea TaxID=1776165 RepID=A0A6L6QI26_9BURK|nr:demethoxyubiquinone hydroxylase family protein [Massilia eburnea]MTW11821.1 demethoxyubiquinone hydroxylase family protein [Massilia eburnea]